MEHDLIVQVIDFGSSLYRFTGFRQPTSWKDPSKSKLLHEQFRLLLPVAYIELNGHPFLQVPHTRNSSGQKIRTPSVNVLMLKFKANINTKCWEVRRT